MGRITLSFVTALCLTAPACADRTLPPVAADAEIVNTDGDAIGLAHFEQGTKGVIINIAVSDLTPGKHGMHLHKVGTCEDAAKGFKASGGHIAPSGKPHGFLHPNGPHAGDLPNLVVGPDGTARVELYTDLVTLKGGPAALLDKDGTALVIHQNPDDYKTQPIGGAGARVACGVVKAIE